MMTIGTFQFELIQNRGNVLPARMAFWSAHQSFEIRQRDISVAEFRPKDLDSHIPTQSAKFVLELLDFLGLPVL